MDDRFEVAVWSGPVLCGLAAGTPRYGRMEVDLAKGSPDGQHPLKGAVRFAVLEAARVYAGVGPYGAAAEPARSRIVD